MKKKKYPLWFETSFEGIRKAEEEFHRTMADMWREPFEFPDIKKDFVKSIPIDLAESNGELILRAELPGFNKDEIKLKVTPTTVDISAGKKKVSIDKGKTFYRQERSYGSARRIMTLPTEVKTEGIKAKFENGILEVIMQKKEVTKKKEEKEIRVE
jgi:HSP20 family protein